MDQMFAPLRKYADFYGRATRTEFWLFFLFRILLFAAFAVVFFIAAAITQNDPDNVLPGSIIVIGFVAFLALLLPELAVTVRRLHDQDLSGWLALLKLAPMGDFVLFIFMLLQGTAGTNRHGPDPREPTADTVRIFA